MTNPFSQFAGKTNVYDFPLDQAEHFYKAQGVGWLNTGDFVRLTKGKERPLFKTVNKTSSGGTIPIYQYDDPKWLPVPAWAFDEQWGNESDSQKIERMQPGIDAIMNHLLDQEHDRLASKKQEK